VVSKQLAHARFSAGPDRAAASDPGSRAKAEFITDTPLANIFDGNRNVSTLRRPEIDVVIRRKTQGRDDP
jgi:hypothetical protein